MIALLITLVAAAQDPAQTLAARVRDTYRKGGDMRGSFVQSYTDQVRHKVRREAGVLRVKADGRLRWTYAGEPPKEFVFDGKTAYFSEPDNGQVTVFEHFAQSPLFAALQFLWGGQDLRQNFEVALAQETDKCPVAASGQKSLRLRPKPSLASLDHACLLVDEKSALVRASRVLDPMGNSTDYEFSNLQFHAHIDAAQFRFHIGKDVSVLKAPQ